VFDQIAEMARPVSHGELQRELDVDEVTLYRTLATLVEAGLVHSVHGIDGVWRYCPQPVEQPGCPGNHAHFLCTRCGSMRCLVEEPMPRVTVPRGAVVHGRHFLAHGLCAACSSRIKHPRRPR
jgi:Fur family ferric uptake transcriptional regulator/Fur family zinc uptake transcriptional regulator